MYSPHSWQVVAAGCWLSLGEIDWKEDAAEKASLQLLWWLADCCGLPEFAWKLPTCVQTLVKVLRCTKLRMFFFKRTPKPTHLQKVQIRFEGECSPFSISVTFHSFTTVYWAVGEFYFYANLPATAAITRWFIVQRLAVGPLTSVQLCMTWTSAISFTLTTSKLLQSVTTKEVFPSNQTLPGGHQPVFSPVWLGPNQSIYLRKSADQVKCI